MNKKLRLIEALNYLFANLFSLVALVNIARPEPTLRSALSPWTRCTILIQSH